MVKSVVVYFFTTQQYDKLSHQIMLNVRYKIIMYSIVFRNEMVNELYFGKTRVVLLPSSALVRLLTIEYNSKNNVN